MEEQNPWRRWGEENVSLCRPTAYIKLRGDVMVGSEDSQQTGQHPECLGLDVTRL
jgi:hypothetical protein